MVIMSEMRGQAVTGVTPPETSEAIIRELWPSVTAYPAVANLGKTLIRSIVLAPLGWFLMLPVYFLKVLPITARKYTLTNRRLMVRTGWKGTVAEEIPLVKIDDVRIPAGGYDAFFRAGTLEIVSGGKVVMTLAGVSFADNFREAILNAATAWAPHKPISAA